MRLPPVLVGMVTAIALGAAAPAAMAGDFCVGVSLPRCPVATFDLSISGIYSAEVAADDDPGPDTVVIAPHVFDLIEPTSFFPAADTAIVGAGVGQTVFQGAYPVQDLLTISGEPGSTASGFSVVVNDDAPGGSGLSVMRSTVSNFTIEKGGDDPSNPVGFRGLELGNGGTAHDATITIGTYAGVGIIANYKSATAYDIEVKTSTDVNSGTGISAESSESGTELNFHHMKIKGFASGVSVADKKLTLTDSLIDLGSGTNTLGVSASAYDSKAIELNVERVTIVGTGAEQTGFSLYAGDAPASLDADIYDIVAYVPDPGDDTFSAIDCWGGTGVPQPANLDLGFFATIGGLWSVLPGCEWNFDSGKFTELYLVDPEFRDAGAGDYRLLRSSPLIDKGGTADTLAASATDLAGGKRAVDGDGGGTVKTDLGAFEYQRAAPQLSIAASATSVLPGAPITFTATASDPEGEDFTLAWNFDDGASAGNVNSVTHAFTTVGPHAATLTATDDANATSVVALEIVVTPIPEAAATARITSKAKKSFKLGKKGFSVAKKGQPSFSVKFTDAAKAKFTLQSIGKNKKLKAVKGSQTLSVTNATTKYFFGGKKLKAGKYRVTITPLSPAGVAGKPVTTDITLK
ncbi:MAG: PKD domain-containing protein [Solirubrobacterales bacterium]